MKNILKLYKIASKRWYLFIFGFIFMFGYGIFSVAGVPFVIPLMDYVFRRTPQASYDFHTVSGFLHALFLKWHQFSSTHEISLFSISDSLKPFKPELEILFYQTDPIVLLKLIVFSLIGVVILKNIFFYLNRLVFINLEGKTTKDLRDILFDKYLSLPFSFFARHKVGDAMVRIVNDVMQVNQFLISNSMKMIRDLFTVFLFIYMAIVINASLFIKILIIIPVLLALVSWLGKKIKKYTKRLQHQLGLIFSRVEEIFRGLKIVKAFNRENFELDRFKNFTLRYFKLSRKLLIYDSLNIPLSELSGVAIVSVVLWFGGLDVLNPDKNFTFGQFSAFLYAIVSILHPLKTVIKGYADLKRSLVSLDRIYEILDSEDTISDAPDAVEMDTFKNKIEFKNVYFSYSGDPEQAVLKNINFTIHRGEKVAIVGATGSGKTTLVNLLPRFYDVTSGQILIDGVDIRNIKIKSLRALFGYVTQDAFLFSESIKHNINYPESKENFQRVQEVSEIAFASEFIEKMPDKYETRIQDYGGNLSGGQKQRISIARAIFHDPPILIFDEATSALDAEAENKVQNAIQNVSKNRTMVIIAHRLATVLSADKILVMKNGEIVAIGKHDELLKSSPEYKTLYDLQFGEPNR
jgi:subfamily B ATP-binding cassette protein MsbA